MKRNPLLRWAHRFCFHMQIPDPEHWLQTVGRKRLAAWYAADKLDKLLDPHAPMAGLMAASMGAPERPRRQMMKPGDALAHLTKRYG